MKRAIAVVCALVWAGALYSCRSSPPEHFYTLKSTAQSAQPQSAAAQSTAPICIVVGPVTIPAIVDRPQIVAYRGANQVTLAEQSRWAEPLAPAISRVVADDLSVLLAAKAWSSTGTALADPDFRVSFAVQRFETVLGQAATIEVLWTVRAAKGGAVKTGRSVVSEPAGGGDYDAVVAAFDRSLTSVSGDIAAAIRGMTPG